jgi:hypothetical protein
VISIGTAGILVGIILGACALMAGIRSGERRRTVRARREWTP